jgi:hypothetical protein
MHFSPLLRFPFIWDGVTESACELVVELGVDTWIDRCCELTWTQPYCTMQPVKAFCVSA